MSTERPDLDAIEALLTAAQFGSLEVSREELDSGAIDWCVDEPAGEKDGSKARIANIDMENVRRAKSKAALLAAAPTALREVIAYARALEAAPNPLTHIPRDEHDREIEALTVRVGHEVAARDAAQARHDADLCEIVAMLREQARIDWRAAERLRRVIAEIETTHAAALARHARRALAPHPEPTPGPRVGDALHDKHGRRHHKDGSRCEDPTCQRAHALRVGGPRCHDCADHDGVCPVDGRRCDGGGS